MFRTTCLSAALVAIMILPAAAQDAPVVFKSDVSLVRVDVQVTDSSNRAIANLSREDFQIRDQGQVRQVVNLSREDLPLDVILLLDVSGSMRPHVERIASAAREALLELGNHDRVAIMVFDRQSRVSMPFKSNHDEILRGFQQLLDRENFNGGTDITRGMMDSIDYMRNHARASSRRAIVILTDDMTERDRDEFRVGRALENANTVMSALLAPDAMGNPTWFPGSGGGSRGGGGRRNGGAWPGSGGGIGGGLPSIIFGPGGGMGGQRMPGGGTVGGHLKSAGTAEIARASGGDSMPVDDSAALQTTLERLRQSYALYFNAPEGATQGQSRSVEVSLVGGVARRYPDAELRYRQTYVVTEGGTTSGGGDANDVPTVTRRNTGGSVFEPTSQSSPSVAADQDSGAPRMKRRPAVNEPGSGGTGGWRKVDGAVASEPEKVKAPPVAEKAPEKAPEKIVPAKETEVPASTGGFRKLKPGEKP